MVRAEAAKSSPVGVISKVLRILEALNDSPAGLPLKDIAVQTGINKSTAYRFLAHLERAGYLFRDDSGAYLAGPRLLRLGSGTRYQMTLRKISRPVLQGLRDLTGETVNLGILDGQDVVYVDVVQSHHPFRMATRLGSLRPLYCTAMGKVLAASLPSSEQERLLTSLRFERFTPRTIVQLERLKEELENVRVRGYAVDDEEAVEGARCVSAPVLLDGDKLAAALSVSGPTTRISRKKIPSFVEAVQKAARTISARLSQNGNTENGLPRKASSNGHPRKIQG